MSTRIAFTSNDTPRAQAARAALQGRYGAFAAAEADVIVALGGDGFMLRTLHAYHPLKVPIYGMKLGRVGFLMNQYADDALPERIARAQPASLNPLSMRAIDSSGREYQRLAFNEVSLLRQTNQVAHLEIKLNGQVKLDNLVCDGVLIATPAGSTAYNLSAYGPILPLDANVLALTPISPFRPRRWRGAILPHRTEVCLTVLDPRQRSTSATADFHEVRDVQQVIIAQLENNTIHLLFDPEHHLEQRILDEQFAAN